MRLNTDEYLLLEHLTYLADVPPLISILKFENYTVAEIIDSIDIDQLEMDKNYGSYLTGRDWKNILQAIRRNPKLTDYVMTSPHIDMEPGGGGGISIVLMKKEEKEVIIEFRGTAPNEWVDDFIGANIIETPQQRNALNWYRSVVAKLDIDAWDITLVGHSKGGNKVKFITLLDDTVNHCIAFDGQGFSDEFFHEYRDRILTRQSIIENHNIDLDYVNILLNDVGPCTFYKGYELGKGGFFEYHCPNTFFEFDEDGNYRMEIAEEGQSPEIREFDYFLNSYLRSMEEDQRKEALLLVGSILEGSFAMSRRKAEFGEYVTFITELIIDPRFTDDVAYLFAYLIKYSQQHPFLLTSLRDILGNLGMDGLPKMLTLIQDILEWNHFDKAFGVLNLVTARIPDAVLGALLSYIKKKRDFDMDTAQLRIILSILDLIKARLEDIEICERKEDLVLI